MSAKRLLRAMGKQTPPIEDPTTAIPTAKRPVSNRTVAVLGSYSLARERRRWKYVERTEIAGMNMRPILGAEGGSARRTLGETFNTHPTPMPNP